MEAENTEGKGSKEENLQLNEKDKPLQFSVTEKVIFCIDATIFSNCGDDDTLFDEIFDMILFYMKLKRKISTEPVFFQCLKCIRGEASLVDIVDVKDLRSALASLRGVEETQEFNMSALFDTLAKTLELPHPELCNEKMPPPLVYHCLLLFGCNLHLPVMKEVNAFHFLVKNPFFSCDTVYLYNNSLDGNNCELIVNALYNMYNIVINGYFFAVNINDSDKQYQIFAQLLGHPLLRPPQNKALYDLKALVSQENAK